MMSVPPGAGPPRKIAREQSLRFIPPSRGAGTSWVDLSSHSLLSPAPPASQLLLEGGHQLLAAVPERPLHKQRRALSEPRRTGRSEQTATRGNRDGTLPGHRPRAGRGSLTRAIDPSQFDAAKARAQNLKFTRTRTHEHREERGRGVKESICTHAHTARRPQSHCCADIRRTHSISARVGRPVIPVSWYAVGRDACAHEQPHHCERERER